MKNLYSKILFSVITIFLIICTFTACKYFIKYELLLTTNDQSICELKGSGTYYPNKQVSVSCKKVSDINKNFLGWYDDEQAISEEMSFIYTTQERNITLVAKWSNEITKLNLYSNKNNNYSDLSESFYKSIEREQQTSMEILPPQESGVIFKGWYKDSALSQLVSNYANLDDIYLPTDTNLYAKWETGYYNLNFICSNPIDYSITPNKTQFSFGEEIKISVPDKYGDLNFIGYYFNDVFISSSNEYLFNMPLYDLQIEAKYSEPSEFSYIENPDGQLIITSYNGSDTELYIPNKIDGKDVVSFTADCFKDNVLTKLFIPQTITSIPNGAFFGVETNLYFDYGFDVSMLSNEIVQIDNSVFVNFKYHDIKNDLIDNLYCIYEGRLADNYIDSKQEFADVYNYLWLYGISGKITLEFKNYVPLEDSSLSQEQRLLNGIKEIITEENNKMTYKSTLANSFKYSANISNAKYFCSLEFNKKSYDLATTTNSPKQTQIDCAISYEAITNSDRKFLYDESKKFMTVNNTEQLLMATSSGFVPITTDETTLLVIAKAKSVLNQIITDDMSDYEKVTNIHDYIVLNNIYDSELLTKSSVESNLDRYKGFYIEGTLLDGLSVCDGIAKTFEFLCRLENITAIKVVGTLNASGHAWNKVLLQDNWYALDVTNDNKIINSSSESLEFLSHELFLVSDSQLESFGCIESPNIDYPQANNTLIIDYYQNVRYKNGTSYNLILNNQSEANALADFVKGQKQTGKRISVEFVIYETDSSKISLSSLLCFGRDAYYVKDFLNDAKLYIMMVG